MRTSHAMSRRGFLGVMAGTALGLAHAPAIWLPPSGLLVPSGLTGNTPVRAAMHVHASWSEGPGSWEAQFNQAVANAIDLLYMTDHDVRLTAYNYATSLTGAVFVTSSTGSCAQKATTSSAGSMHLLAESSATSAPATVTMAVQDRPFARNRLRTSIAGLTIAQQVTSAAITGGARYDIVIPLSYHPARNGRPAGQYQLTYRFGGTNARWTEGNGLLGVLRRPTPSAGSVLTLKPEQDVAALWPDMLAIDNSLFGMSFVASSPRRGEPVDMRIASTTFQRTQNTPSAAAANQARLVSAYQALFPTLTVRPQTEVSQTLPDMNTFGLPQWIPDNTLLSADHDTRYREVVDTVHDLGGLISWNHPLGTSEIVPYTASQAITARRQVFSSMQAVDRFGVDILEVGYTLRNGADAATHIALWDTFSRNGNFLTGNGASDDHSGQGWKTMKNGFATGIWAPSRTEADVRAALAAGRAYATHVGWWPNGQLDIRVDDLVPMGGVSVSSKTTRSIAIWATNLPVGSVVELVAGPVDYKGAVDPGTSVLRSLLPSAFSGGMARVSVDTTSSKFFRAQVRRSSGEIIGTSNPVWLLRSAPPGGVPLARR